MERLKDTQESGVVLILGTTDWQRHMIYKELQRIDPRLAPVPSEEAGPSTVVEVISAPSKQALETSTISQQVSASLACRDGTQI